MSRRQFIGQAGAFALLPALGGGGDRPVRFLFMTDHHVESDFVQGFGKTKGLPDFVCWKPGNHAALAETYRFINTHPACQNLDFALFGGDQLNTGYDCNPEDMAAEKVNYFRTLEALDLHAKTKGQTADLDFVAEPWECHENLSRKRLGQVPYRVTPKPPESRVIAIQGNHDTGVREFYRNCAFTAGDVRVITFFASYVGLPPPPGRMFHSTAKISDETMAFLEREMLKAASNSAIRHIVLCSHWAIAPAGKDFACPILDARKENGMSDNRRKLLALAERCGCDLYLNGHEHNGRYPVGKAGCLTDISCGTVSGDPAKGQGAFAIVEIRRDKAVFEIYSRAAAVEKDGLVTITARPRLLFVREIPLQVHSSNRLPVDKGK